MAAYVVIKLGKKVPKFDIGQVYAEGDVRDLLIRTKRLGEHLAACFAQESGESYNPVVLMRGHGSRLRGPVSRKVCSGRSILRRMLACRVPR